MKLFFRHASSTTRGRNDKGERTKGKCKGESSGKAFDNEESDSRAYLAVSALP